MKLFTARQVNGGTITLHMDEIEAIGLSSGYVFMKSGKHFQLNSHSTIELSKAWDDHCGEPTHFN